VEAPVRTCLACRARRSKHALIRLVAEPGDAGHVLVTADPRARRPGRGAYVCAHAPCVEALLAGGVRSAARALRVDPAVVRVDGEALRSAVRHRARQDEETTATAAGRAPQRPRAA
jgi:predicted RNA-binding protein YlxR (DUF448 family)